MTKAEIAELKVRELEMIVDDLASLAQNPFARASLRKMDLEGVERRLRHLRFDLVALEVA